LVDKSTSKKGVSPILATLLLIVIAVAAAVITFSWVIIFTTRQSATAGKIIKYDSAFVNATSGMVTAYVRNWGTEDVTLDRVYINAVDYTRHVILPPDFPTSGTPLSVDAVVEIIVNGTAAGLDFIPGNTYKVKVAGPGVEWQEIATIIS